MCALSLSFRWTSISSSRTISPFLCPNCSIWFSSLFWLLGPIKPKCHYILNYGNLKEGKTPVGLWFKSGIPAPTEATEGRLSTLSSTWTLPPWREEKTWHTLSTPSCLFVWWKMSILPRVGTGFLLTSKDLWKTVSPQNQQSSFLILGVRCSLQVIAQQLEKVSSSSLSGTSAKPEALSTPRHWEILIPIWRRSKLPWNWRRRNWSYFQVTMFLLPPSLSYGW